MLLSICHVVNPLLSTAHTPLLGAACTAVSSMLSKLKPASFSRALRVGGLQQQPCRLIATRASKPSEAAPARAASRQRVPRLSRVDGLGRKYEALLQQQGITTVEQLAERLLSSQGSAHTVEALSFLKGVGIRRADHQQKIVAYIQTHYGDASAASAAAAAAASTSNMLTFCVEGNISAGKSTFLQYITEHREGREELARDTKVVPEPVDRWQDARGPKGSLNMLEHFYSDPPRYAYPFQNYVFLTRVLAERDSAHDDAGVRLMERSVFSDRMVFVRTIQESGWMGDVELTVYDSWFDPILNSQPSLLPDGFIYLRANPEVCMDRLKKRNRGGEDKIDMDYLQGLHSKHEDWLGSGTIPAQQWLQEGKLLQRADSSNTSSYSSSSSGLLVPQAPQLQVPDSIAGQLYFQQQSPALPELLVGVPALVLDCNNDVLHDEDLKTEFQDKVLSYIQFMRECRKLQLEAGVGPYARRYDASRGTGIGVAGRGVLSVSPGAPADPKVQQHLEHVQEASRSRDAKVVAANAGTVLPAPVAVDGDVSGSLEVLQKAVSQQLSSRLVAC